MGEVRKAALRVDFDSRIELKFHSAAVTSYAGLVAYREHPSLDKLILNLDSSPSETYGRQEGSA
ncbi:MAG TPA: hypothetical protein VMZ31_13510 [Phycisphaerae bacterium]|nr:hypothetical protein [Phycisphaerae bacterium]